MVLALLDSVGEVPFSILRFALAARDPHTWQLPLEGAEVSKCWQTVCVIMAGG